MWQKSHCQSPLQRPMNASASGPSSSIIGALQGLNESPKFYVCRFPQIRGTFLGVRVPIMRNNNILGSILGSPYFGKLPYLKELARKKLSLDPKPYPQASLNRNSSSSTHNTLYYSLIWYNIVQYVRLLYTIL